MRAYLDASVLVSLFVRDALTARADAWLRGARPAPIVSDFAAAELASALARRVRMRALRAEEAQAAFVAFDAWTTQQAERARTISADVAAAEAWLRRLDLTLRTPDARSTPPSPGAAAPRSRPSTRRWRPRRARSASNWH